MGILAAPIRRITGAKPGRREVNVKMLALALIALAIAKVVNVFDAINRRIHKAPFGMMGCTFYPSIMAPEDIVPVFDGVFVASSDERRKHFMWTVGVPKTQMGQLFAVWNVDTLEEGPMVAPLALEGFPIDTAFRPHGMHYRQETGELFVVNHAYSMGGERIDVFRVEETSPQIPLPKAHPSIQPRYAGAASWMLAEAGAAKESHGRRTEAAHVKEDGEEFQGDAARPAAIAEGASEETAPVKVTYSFSVEHELVTSSFGVLNDLVLVGDDELYVTKCMPMPYPVRGPTHPAGVLETLRLYTSKLLKTTRLARPPVVHCTRIRSKEIRCEHLARGHGIMYSGIAVSPDRERLLVSDLLDPQVLVFKRSLETGALTLQQRVKMAGSPKNIQLDFSRAAEGEEAYTMGLQHPWDMMAHARMIEGASDPTEGDSTRMAGGVASLTYEEQTGKYFSSLEMWRNDSLFAVSSAAVTRSGARLLGSSVSPGFMLCPLSV